MLSADITATHAFACVVTLVADTGVAASGADTYTDADVDADAHDVVNALAVILRCCAVVVVD